MRVHEEVKRDRRVARQEPLAGPVALLPTLRGIATLSAATIAAETCDFARFLEAGSHMALRRLRKVAARKGAHTAVVTAARELTGFVWGLSTGDLSPTRCTHVPPACANCTCTDPKVETAVSDWGSTGHLISTLWCFSGVPASTCHTSLPHDARRRVKVRVRPTVAI